MKGKSKLQKFGVFLFFGLALVVNCSVHHQPKTQTIVLSYGELGPQVLVYELIGFEWFQWNNSGGSDPDVFDDVKVVVYRDIPLEQVKQMYPVIKEKKSDYRYLDYKTAIGYLNEYENESHLEHLKTTKIKIVENLGD